MSALKTPEYLLERLADHNVGQILGIPGDHVVPFLADAERSGPRVSELISKKTRGNPVRREEVGAVDQMMIYFLVATCRVGMYVLAFWRHPLAQVRLE